LTDIPLARKMSSSKTTLVVNFSSASRNPLNPLGADLRKLIWLALDKAEKDNSIGSVILYGGGSTFSAGADITEFGQIGKPKYSNNELVNKIENFTKPVVAAISGNTLGGGLEVAMSCHYRVTDETGKFGLPEVHVGVIPGAGGTQRLPRLVGVIKALEMILTGKPIGAQKAKKLGLVDHIVTTSSGGSLIESAKKYAQWAELMPLADRRVGKKKIKESRDELQMIFAGASAKLPPIKMGGEGVKAALEAVKACSLPVEEGSAIEMKQFLRTLSGTQGKARRHAFFAVRKAQKMLGNISNKNHPLLQKSFRNQTVAVVGAGLMGSGICMVLLQAGFTVHLLDVYKAALDKGVGFLRGTIQSYAKRGRISIEKAKRMSQALKPTQKFEDLSNCVLVVEAVIENMKIKKKIFSTLDKITPPGCILLSNTSTLDIDEMASR
jgi:enoyl-CoA hydratase/carnithine racemase